MPPENLPEMQALRPIQTNWVKDSILARLSDDSYEHESLTSTGLDYLDYLSKKFGGFGQDGSEFPNL